MPTLRLPQLALKGDASPPVLHGSAIQSTYYEAVRDHLRALLHGFEAPVVRELDDGFAKVGPDTAPIRTYLYNPVGGRFGLNERSQDCISGARKSQIWRLIVESRSWVTFETMEDLLLSRPGMDVIPSPGSDLERRFLLLGEATYEHSLKEERDVGSRASYTLDLVHPEDALSDI